MLLALYVALVAVQFLWQINSHLQGTSTPKIGAFLSLAWVGVLVATAVVGVWTDAVLAAVLSLLVFRPLLRTLAQRAAVAMLGAGEPGGAWPGPAPSAIRRAADVIGNVSPTTTVEALMARGRELKVAEDALFTFVEQQPATRAVLERHAAGRAELKELLSLLHAAGAGQPAPGHFVSVSALAFPHTLDYALRSRRPGSGISATELASALVMHFQRGAPLPAPPPAGGVANQVPSGSPR